MTAYELSELIREYIQNKIELEELSSAADKYLKNNSTYLVESEGIFEELFSEYICSKTGENDYFLLSLYANICKRESVYSYIYEKIIESTKLSKENKYFILWQLGRKVFLNVSLQTERLRQLKDDLYEDIYQNYMKDFENFTIIPKEQRNENLVFVFVMQLVDLNHGPTKMLFDRCYTLQKEMGKRVLIINTAEILTPNGILDNWFDPEIANYFESFSENEYVEFKDEKFALFQCPQIMPETDVIKMLINVINKEKPWCAVTVGELSITSDICSGLIPVFTLPTVYSGIACTRSQFQMKTGNLTEEEIRWMNKHGYTEEHFVKEIFTFTFKEQTHHYTRDDLSLPVNGKIAIVCSGRLNEEVDDEFMAVVRKLAEKGIYTAFAGGFDKLRVFTEKDKLLEKYTINLGYQTDMLAVYECCDFYLNPYRQGGGCSAAEALFKGLPAFSLNYGDVGVSVGEDFHVSDYEQMADRLIEMANNPLTYKCMSEKAKERGVLLIDSVRPFMHAMRMIENRSSFR